MKKLYAALLAICIASALQAKITIPAYFTDNMVLQQKKEVRFFGHTSAREQVTVRVGWNKSVYQASVDEKGNWSVRIPTPAAGGPYTVLISDQSDERVLSNVMIGEVWLCSGQSNMEMPLAGWGKVLNYEQEIAAANYPSIRLFQVKKNTSLAPENDFQSTMGGWKECSPTTVPEFSSVGYFFSQYLWKELNVPIGVIDCTWGGTPAEAWTSFSSLQQLPDYKQEMECLQAMGFETKEMQGRYEKERTNWMSLLQIRDKGYLNSQPAWASRDLPEDDWSTMRLPGYWESLGLDQFDGVVWFRKHIQIPETWVGQPLTISLGIIDDEDIVYCNGKEIARGSGYNSPRQYTIPADLTHLRELVITVRVSDFGGEGGISGEAKNLFLSAKDGNRIPLAGEWLYKVGISLADLPATPVSPAGNSSYPTVLYNAMVNPLIHFPVKGVIWYQGEANSGRAKGYADLFQTMISDWRDKWENPRMPFYFVQLANFMERKEVQPHSEWAFLREAQASALHLDNTGMAVNIDLGLSNDIHPKNKREVARRLSLIALKNTYKKKVAAQAPVYCDYKIIGDKVHLSFDQVGKGFRVKGELKGFTIAGANRKFFPAVAVLEGTTLIVQSPQVKHPIAVRYAWADNPECTLYGSEDLPVAPFRTDSW